MPASEPFSDSPSPTREPEPTEVTVVGAGVMGTAIAHALSTKGTRTVVLDRFFPDHPFGSSHGRTRILRVAYSEGREYVPLVSRARVLWTELAHRSGRPIFEPTGVLVGGSEGNSRVQSAIDTARRLGLPHEVLDASAIRGRFPVFTPAVHDAAVFDPRGGVIRVEEAIGAMRKEAEEAGTRFRFGVRFLTWQRHGAHIEVETDSGRSRTGHLVLAGGPWMGRLVPELSNTLVVERQSVFWFAAKSGPGEFGPRRMPAFTWDGGRFDMFYGTPDLGDGIKVAGHGGQVVADSDHVARRIRAGEREKVRDFVRSKLPKAGGRIRASTTCLFTNTPNGRFILGTHPKDERVSIVSACSGHGFKFAPAIGESLAAQIRGEIPPVDLTPFSPNFSGPMRVPAEAPVPKIEG